MDAGKDRLTVRIFSLVEAAAEGRFAIIAAVAVLLCVVVLLRPA
jgi:CHASE3 domain sensor protein